MKVLYYDLNRRKEIEDDFGIQYVSLPELLANSDFVTIHTNLSLETHHLISEKQFETMKKTSILVNTARGPIVDNMALYYALRDGKIGAAELDVTDPEPLPSDHPLLTLNNVIVTPHIASASVATRTKMAMMAAENLIIGLKGELPPNPVNPDTLKKGSEHACFGWVHVDPPSGAFYVFPRISDFGLTSMEFATTLAKEGHLATVPSSAYGEAGEGHIRISFAASRSNIMEGCNRISAIAE